MKITNSIALVVGAAASVAMASPPDAFTVTAQVRDMSPAHPDFDPGQRSAGHVTGLLSPTLDDAGYPSATGDGDIVGTPWLDENGNPTAGPFGSDLLAEAQKVTDFEIDDGVVTVNEDFAVRVRVLGSAIETGSYTIPTTSRVSVSGQVFEPFGAYLSPVAGNLNDDPSSTGGSPRSDLEYVAAQKFSAGSMITVDGRSWMKTGSGVTGLNDGDWKMHMDESTTGNSPQIFVLRDGDAVPEIDGVYSQADVREYVSDYIDVATDTITLETNEVIYLFELGTSYSNSSADFQDLVVLLDFAKNPQALEGFGDVCGTVPDYTEPVLTGTSRESIGSDSSLDDWFKDKPGKNATALRSLRFSDDDGDGIYEYWDNDFAPIDGQLYRNDDGDSNRYFTMSTEFEGIYNQCSGDFVEVASDASAWVYINGQLVIDLGGEADGKSQRIELDRLGLPDGEPYTVQIFYAQRSAGASEIGIRTNIMPTGSRQVIRPGSAFFD